MKVITLSHFLPVATFHRKELAKMKLLRTLVYSGISKRGKLGRVKTLEELF